jgi:hypothetical protein
VDASRRARLTVQAQIQSAVIFGVAAALHGGGMGEAGTSCIVPAVANAIFAATGKLPVETAQAEMELINNICRTGKSAAKSCINIVRPSRRTLRALLRMTYVYDRIKKDVILRSPRSGRLEGRTAGIQRIHPGYKEQHPPAV